MEPTTIAELAHEIADLVVNPTGYADDNEEADRRRARRSKLETAIRATAGGELGAAEAIGRIYGIAEDGLELETLDALLKRAGFRTPAGLIDGTGRALEETERTEELAEELEENGLGDLADYLRRRGLEEARRWLEEEELPRARTEDRELHHGEGFELGNLETALERLEAALR